MENAIKAKKEVEEQKIKIEKYKDHLEELVAERTKDLTAANEELKGLDRLKSKFIDNMSHELRTPLNAIIGFSEVLQDEAFGPLNEKQKNYVSKVVMSGNHLLALINDVLDITEIESGKMKLAMAEISIKKLLEEALLIIKEKFFTHDFEVSLEIGDEIEFFKVDERLIKQIVNIGLSNAVKFTPNGGKIKISVNKSDCEMEIIIKDTGIGIAIEDQAKLFNEFFQIENPHIKQFPGTGLGLFLAKKLVELHGGKIWVESDGLGKGTIFRFMLPNKE
jgi:signal transduction histidine kinase